jgi:prepilin-type processing-associated H-X9-DG protein
MAIDLTGGLSDNRELVFASQPDDPEMRESVNAWIWDDGAEFGFPRIGIEAVGDQWDTHDNQVNIAFADGRVLNIFAPGDVHNPLGADGKARVLGAGPLSFELIEPYKHWRMRLDGLATETSAKEQMDSGVPHGDGAQVPVQMEIDLHSAVPPWEVGTLREEAAHVLATQEEGYLMGGPRIEQLARVTGTFTVDGVTHSVNGGALRVRRQGIRRLTTFWGHAWQSSLFPSGRAFGSLVYPPRADGKTTLNEAFIFEGDGELVPARIIKAPWLESLQATGQKVTLVLETPKGETTIEGETVASTFHNMGGGIGPNAMQLQQCIVRYTWDGETANGMLERSSPAANVTR